MKKKKDYSKGLLMVLLVMLIILVVLIPCLYYAEVKKILPVVAFLLLPVIFGIIIVLLSRNCFKDYRKKLDYLEKIS